MENLPEDDKFTLYKEIEKFFYELHFGSLENQEDVIKKIVKNIPWDLSISKIIDNFHDSSLRMSSRKLIPTINFELVSLHLKKISSKGHKNSYNDLEKSVFLLSLMGDPNADYQIFKKKLDDLAFRLEELFELNKSILTDEVKVHLLSRVMHQEEGFNGNQIFYHNPDNSYLTKVIKSKYGIPISLAILYMLVGHRLNLPLFGVNIPLHFMISYETENFQTFIDPFNSGVLLDKETCLKFLEANGYRDSKNFFSKASTLSILRRMYNNLILIYKKLGEVEMEEKFSKQLILLENKQNFI
jgi:regulator of sirC expression with transglutaminase-like and TPR domain